MVAVEKNNNKYSACVFVAFGAQCAQRMRRVCHSVACPGVQDISPHYLINGTILGKKLLNTKCEF